MARNPMQDIVPKNGKSIRNIPIPEHRNHTAPKKERKPDPEEIEREEEIAQEEAREEEALKEAREEFEEISHRHGRRKGKKSLVIGLLVLAVIVLAVLLSTVFHGATLTVTPKTASASIQGDLVAKKIPGANDLGFKTVSLTESASAIVRASGEKQVDKRATGTIVVYNNYSSSPQRLIKNTRFETPEGLIYRISDSITVPGKKGSTPGSVETVVLADEPGEKYNVGLKDFTIPGFKGDPRYTTFYARSKTPLAGGFSGVVKVIADADRTKAKTEIESKLRESLTKKFADMKTPDSILYDKAYRIDFKELPEEAVSDTQVTLKEEGTLSAASFDREALSSALARLTVNGYKGEPILARNLDSLSFAPKGTFNPSSDSVSFTMSGNTTFEWLYNEKVIKDALVSKTKDAAPAALAKFPMIEKADISIRPIWSRTFPASPDKITVEKASE